MFRISELHGFDYLPHDELVIVLWKNAVSSFVIWQNNSLSTVSWKNNL